MNRRTRQSADLAAADAPPLSEIEANGRKPAADVAALLHWAGLPNAPYYEAPGLEPSQEADLAEEAACPKDRPSSASTAAPQEDMQSGRIAVRRRAATFPAWMTAASRTSSFAAEQRRDEESQEEVFAGAAAFSTEHPNNGTAAAQLIDGTGLASVIPHPEVRNRSSENGNGAAAAYPSWIDKEWPSVRQAGVKVTAETLHTTRERVASRWFGLRSAFGQQGSPEEARPADERETLPPALALFSVAGGVGKTSLAASVTRSLAAQGERVLLIDMTQQELLPMYFGAPGRAESGLRVFTPPTGTTDTPVHLLTSGPELENGTGKIPQGLGASLEDTSRGYSRLIIDLPTADARPLPTLTTVNLAFLVPVTPDMHSVLSLQRVRQVLSSHLGTGAATRTRFLLTQFDPAERLHLDIRELLTQELGDSLLPFAVRRSAAVAEALAQAMTLLDYAPRDAIAQDIQQLAAWVRSSAQPATHGLSQARWSER